MEFTFALGYIGLAVLIAGAILVGIGFQLVGTPHFGYEWLVTALGAFIGGLVASEFVIVLRDWGPVFDGLALVPALVGGLAIGALTAGITRLLTREPLASAA